jgi:hypothetical protein
VHLFKKVVPSLINSTGISVTFSKPSPAIMMRVLL